MAPIGTGPYFLNPLICEGFKMLLEHIVFLQGDDAIEALTRLKDQGEEFAIEYLLLWDYGEGEQYNYSYWGKGDIIYSQDDLILSYNLSLGYINLCRKLG